MSDTKMMQPIPYVMFNGNCREAVEFYAKTLGGVIRVMLRGSDTPIADQIPKEFENRIMNAQLELPGGALLYAGDAHPEMPYDGIRGVSITLNFDNVDEGERIFGLLAEGGKVTMPYGPTFWSKKFGMCVDRFGLDWIINGELLPIPGYSG